MNPAGEGTGYVGREAELAELSAALDDALAGHGRLRLISGEPGIGKTRLCDELSARAHARGVAVTWGRCWEAGGAPAYFPWREPLGALCAALDNEGLVDALGEGASALAELVPSLRARLPALPRVIADTAQSERFRLYFAVLSLLRRASASSGALIVLDDLHAADESSLGLLYFLSRELRGARTLVLATFRDVEARATKEVAEALQRLGREGSLLSLARLGPESSARLLRERCGIVDGAVHDEVFRRTQGNPLFLEHMGSLLRAQGGAEAARSLLPSGVRELIGQRLARVSARTHALLEASAVSGDEWSAETVADAAGASLEQTRACLAEALQAGLLIERERGQLRFSHALVREVIERDLPPERSRALHGALARTLEARASKDELPHARLAHHGLLGPDPGLTRAVGHALEAARGFSSMFAFEEAIALLERARAALEGRLGGEAAQGPLSCDVWIALGEAQIRGGRGAVGQASCLRAAELARAQRDAERLALAALAYGREITAALVQSTLVALLEEALAALPVADTPLRVQVSARLAAAMQPHHDLQVPIDLARAAIASARRIGDPATLLDALFSGMATMMDIVDPRERIPLNLEIEQLASDAGDWEKLLRSQARLTFDHMELGDLTGADARIAAYERLARKAGAPRHVWRVPLFHAMRALVHGRFAEAEERLEHARELGLQAGDPQLERCYVFHREGLLRAAERHAEMVAFDPEARRMRAALYSGPHWKNGGSAFTHVRLEAFDEAHMYLSLVPQDDWPLVQNPPAFMHLGEPLALIGERSAAERLYAQLLPAAHRHLSWGWSKFLWDGPATRVLGLLAARLERWDDALAHFEKALADLERMQALPYLARTRYELGRALHLRGGAHDLRAARAHLASAHELAQRLGQSGLVRLAERRLEQLGSSGTSAAPVQVARAPVPELPFSFTREGEYVCIRYAGQSVRLRDSLGLRYLARLAEEPGRELHVLELSGGAASGGDDAGVIDAGDAGELLDETAKQRYRARLLVLREAREEAEARADVARAQALEEEEELLTAELSRAVGRGGRARRAGGASERARSAVQRRIRSAIEHIRAHSAELAELLERSVRTGTHCELRPEHARPRGAVGRSAPPNK